MGEPSVAASAAAGAEDDRPRLRALLYVLALVVPPAFLRGCVFETYVVQGRSMSPTFVGEGDADRLLVLQRALDPRPLSLWDAIVLDSDLDRDLAQAAAASFKRVAGLPGDLVEVRDGDLFRAPAGAPAEELARAVKSDDLVRTVLVAMVEGEGLPPPWRLAGAENTGDDGRPETIDATDDAVTAAFESVVSSGTPEDPGPDVVADTALALDLEVDGAVVHVGLRDGPDVFRARLADAARGGAALFHNRGGVVATDPTFAGLSGRVRVEAWNVDHRVRVFVDGQLILAHDRAETAGETAPPRRLNAPEIRVEDGVVRVLESVVYRDLHYTEDGRYATDADGGLAPFRVPPEHLFVLGDLSYRSRDSRHFGPVPVSAVRGRPLAIYAPAARRQWLSPGGPQR